MQSYEIIQSSSWQKVQRKVNLSLLGHINSHTQNDYVRVYIQGEVERETMQIHKVSQVVG